MEVRVLSRAQMEDNARKFIVDDIDTDFLKKNNAISFTLIVDWITKEEESEKKIVFKNFENGEVQFLMVEKVTIDGNRKTNKRKLDKEEYEELLKSSIVHLEKKRYEFDFVQNDISFSLKYDEFKGEKLRILEVDAENENDRKNFSIEDFPYNLKVVTGDMKYYGYRVVSIHSVNLVSAFLAVVDFEIEEGDAADLGVGHDVVFEVAALALEEIEDSVLFVLRKDGEKNRGVFSIFAHSDASDSDQGIAIRLAGEEFSCEVSDLLIHFFVVVSHYFTTIAIGFR